MLNFTMNGNYIPPGYIYSARVEGTQQINTPLVLALIIFMSGFHAYINIYIGIANLQNCYGYSMAKDGF